MSSNLTFILGLLISGIVKLGFLAFGIYALQQGYIKTGGWLIAAGILALLFNGIKTDDSEKK